MSKVREIHHQAVALGHQAFKARDEGDIEEYQKLTKRAFAFEKDAALLLLEKFEAQPTRSILFRSAATLAYNCGEFEEANTLIGLGLSGNAPQEIKDELEDLKQRVILAITARKELQEGGIKIELKAGIAVANNIREAKKKWVEIELIKSGSIYCHCLAADVYFSKRKIRNLVNRTGSFSTKFNEGSIYKHEMIAIIPMLSKLLQVAKMDSSVEKDTRRGSQKIRRVKSQVLINGVRKEVEIFIKKEPTNQLVFMKHTIKKPLGFTPRV